jgi:dTMP kinase
MNIYPGILIAFDGIDGAGKTTQVLLLKSALEGVGETVVVSKEPTDGQWGQKLRDSALTGRMAFEEELEAFILDRQDHLSRKVIPALEAGHVVILDRYFYSTIAYQGILVHDHATIEARIRANVVNPDVAYWMDLPADLAVGRVISRDGRPNLFEHQGDLDKAGKIFHSISKADPVLRRVDATMSVPDLHRSILEDLIVGAFKNKRCGKSYGCDDPIYCTPRITKSCKWWSAKEKLSLASKMS